MIDDDKDFIKDDLLNLNTEVEQETAIDVQERIVNKFKEDELLNDSLSKAVLDPKSDGFIEIIKDNVNYCVQELKEVNEAMDSINNQKNTEMFFRKSENIRLLSQYMTKVASVNQKTIDLIILLLGAGGKISDEYDTILSTIDELSSLNNGEAQVLDYLLKIKKMVNDIKDNELTMKRVMEESEKNKEIIAHADEAFKKEVEESAKARKTIDSKCNRLAKRIRLNNLYIGFCLLLIVALAVFIGLKFYVFKSN